MYVFVLGVRVQQVGIWPVWVVLGGITQVLELKFSENGMGNTHCAPKVILNKSARRKLYAFMRFLYGAKVTRLAALSPAN